MPEFVTSGVEISKDEFAARVPDLRVELVNAQYELADTDVPVLVVIAGPDQTGISEVVNRLNEWMDARYTNVQVFRQPVGERLRRPWLYDAWTHIPARGEMAVFAAGYAAAIALMAAGQIDERTFERLARHQRHLEEDLIADGAVVVKLWLQISKADLAKRLKSAKKRKDERWRIDRNDVVVLEHYDDIMAAATRYAGINEPPDAPWLIVDSTDRRYRDLTVAETVLAAIKSGLTRAENGLGARTVRPFLVTRFPDALAEVDLSAQLAYDDYKKALNEAQAEVAGLWDRMRDADLASVLVFEGWDAAGKGGAIRRLTAALDVGDYRIVPIAAPTQEELAHHYLWRFWRRLPNPGELLVFDRSWYGRVLVERVEGFATEPEWQGAYAEIVDFEDQLVEHGWPVLKFWLHIDPEEQQRRFEQRTETPYKKYKITEEDLRNREKWDAYVPAVNEMVARTSTPRAPWHLVPANDKRYARVAVLRAVAASLQERLERA